MPESVVLRPGLVVQGHEVISTAPLELSKGYGFRIVNGAKVSGTYSQPHWGFGPLGWVVVRRWKTRGQAATKWTEAVPEMNVIVVNKTVMIPGDEVPVA